MGSGVSGASATCACPRDQADSGRALRVSCGGPGVWPDICPPMGMNRLGRLDRGTPDMEDRGTPEIEDRGTARSASRQVKMLYI